jgi:dolichol-phosphate mannosyltransferase
MVETQEFIRSEDERQQHRGSTALDLATIHLGIVCPMANERATAADFVEALLGRCREFEFSSISLFVVLDTKSTDGTRELLEELAERESQLNVVWAPENRCAVDAYVRGYHEALAADCDWILEIDGGFSHSPDDVPAFFRTMAKGYDCVFGSRFCAGGQISDTPAKRKLLSGGGTFLVNLLLGTRLHDMTSGYQLFSREALQHVLERGIRSRGHFFQTEMKVYCRGFDVAEVPIHYRAASDSVSRGVVKDALVQLWRLFRLRLAGQL